jgi:hypothetical protein
MTRGLTITQQGALQVSGRSLACTVIPQSGIEQIGWTAGGDEGSEVGRLGFVGGGEQVTNVVAVGFNN